MEWKIIDNGDTLQLWLKDEWGWYNSRTLPSDGSWFCLSEYL